MNLNFSEAEVLFKEEVKSFLDSELTADLVSAAKHTSAVFTEKDVAMEWQSKLVKKGWLVPSWPEEYGGTGWSITQKHIFQNELADANTPTIVPFGVSMCGPVVYTFGTQDPVPEIVDTTLPSPFIVTTPTVSATDELRARNEEAIAVLLVNVAVDDLFVTDFEVQAKRSTDSVFINLGRGSSSQFELVNVEDNVIYDIRARSVTSVSRSSFVSIQHQVIGKTEPPEDVTNFSVNIIGTEAHLSWTPVTDLDLSHYKI